MHYSLTDHFLCSPSFVNNTDCTHILVHGDNTSGHLAISVSLHLPADIKFSSTTVDGTFKFRWERADLSYFQAVLTSSLSSLSLPTDAVRCRGTECTEQASKHANSVDNCYSNIISCLQYATKVCGPEVKVGLEKHSWTPDLEHLKKNNVLMQQTCGELQVALVAVNLTLNRHTHTQPFNGLLSGTTRVGRYQKKHSPTYTQPDHRTYFIIFLHLQRSMASSLFILRA